MIEARGLDEIQQLSEFRLALAGEADDEGRPQREIGNRRSRPFDERGVAPGVAAPPHRLEDLAARVLQRDVEVGNKAIIGRHEFEQTLVEGRGIGVEKADPREIGLVEKRRHEPCEDRDRSRGPHRSEWCPER